MLLEVVEDRFNFGSHHEQRVLLCRHHFFLLFEMGRGDNDGAVRFPDILAHNTGPIVGIADNNPCIMIDQFRQHLRIVDISRREDYAAQFIPMIYGGMQLESIVLSLMVLPKLCDTFGYFMGLARTSLQTSSMVESVNRTGDVLEKLCSSRYHNWGMTR
jgi:hypothetical protein